MAFISSILLPFHFLKSDQQKKKVRRCGLDIDGHNAMHFNEKKLKKGDEESENGVR